MFTVNYENGAVSLHQGDTGSYKVRARRKSGTDWTEDDRMLLTIWNGSEILIQRIYRLDDDNGLGNGVVLLEFHNEDTDDLPVGNYSMERRYIVNPVWEVATGESIPTEKVVDALQIKSKIVDGHIVRTPRNAQTTFEVRTIYGEV